MATAATELDPLRKRVLIRGTLFSSQGTHVIWIRDISPSGALVSSQDRLPAYGDVALKRGAMFVAAHVVSSTDNGATLEFYRELKATEINSATVAASQHHD